MSLFQQPSSDERKPLAARMRPSSLNEFIGQEHLAAEGSPTRTAIERGSLGSVILWGPPGSGKTTLARIIAHMSDAHLEERSAVTCGIAEIKAIGQAAKHRTTKTLLFLDEIHHFSRTQQDALLGLVEDGTVQLIGATTENPTFSLGTPLLSRCRVLALKPLSENQIRQIIERAQHELDITLNDQAIALLCRWANGDARAALNALELSAQFAFPNKSIGEQAVAQAMQRPVTKYDAAGDQHYDVISAFIKSVRGSDVDASLHYLARMLKAGEDIRFIARRLIILASEDIGNAEPMGLILAVSALNAIERIGMPEARIILGHVTAFLATAPKSNAAYLGIQKALDDLDEHPAPPIPDHLRDANTKRFEHDPDETPYKYPHDFGGWVPQKYLSEPNALSLPYYQPTDNGRELKIKRFLQQLDEQK